MYEVAAHTQQGPPPLCCPVSRVVAPKHTGEDSSKVQIFPDIPVPHRLCSFRSYSR